MLLEPYNSVVPIVLEVSVVGKDAMRCLMASHNRRIAM
jgi:hypothetical protein